MGKERRKMETQVRSRELLELEQEKHSFLEFNLSACKKEKGEMAKTKRKKLKKREQVLAAEDSKEETTNFVPTSHVLGKVKDFLGVIAQANEKLHQSTQADDISKHDIEVLTGNETEYIEMDLLLGITDLQTPEAVAVAEAAIGASRQYLPLMDGNDSSDSEDNSDEENDNIFAESIQRHSDDTNMEACNSSMPIHSSKRPKITELN